MMRGEGLPTDLWLLHFMLVSSSRTSAALTKFSYMQNYRDADADHREVGRYHRGDSVDNVEPIVLAWHGAVASVLISLVRLFSRWARMPRRDLQ